MFDLMLNFVTENSLASTPSRNKWFLTTLIHNPILFFISSQNQTFPSALPSIQHFFTVTLQQRKDTPLASDFGLTILLETQSPATTPLQ